ncbi:HTR-like protein [Haloferax elongans ATCC BAA-1513]|uniref:histidine kinase n=1 Tax=Haloferax elongans ATCC BAA-1513 TaxID=1230453 RepID=M0HN33_HALEO|nr:ATP-binding protein [Haloferax elongans]ELZ85921.1 HTR-like protein [Haloferax elongans ATCC BAA-1513]
MIDGGGDDISILHVDDDPMFSELVSHNLTRRIDGVHIDTCERPDVVLDRVESDAVDCIVSDYQMPGMNGVELLEAVRESSDVPFILFTGHGSEAVASDAIAAGVTDYVQKDPGGDQWVLLANRVRRAISEYRAVEAQKESNRRFSTLIRAMPGVAYRSPIDSAWPMDFVSEGCRELTGYDPAELESGEVMWGADIVHPEHRGDGWDEILAAVEAGDRFDRTYRIRTRDGETKWVREQGLGVMEDGEAVAIEGYIFDVTDEHRRGIELRQKETLLDSLFENVPVHLFVKDDEARHVRVSSALVDDPESFVGKTDLEACVASEIQHRRRAYEDDRHVLETGEPILDKEEYVSNLDRWNLTSKVPWTDDDGNVVGIIGVSQDTTERKRRKQVLSRQNERLAEFANIVSHDLRNPLSVAHGNLELLQDDIDDERLETVADTLDRIDDIVEDVLSMAREGRNVLDRERVSLADAVEEAWQTVHAEGATLELPESLGTIHCDRARLVRLLENLLRNATEHAFTDDRTTPEITVQRLEDEVGFAVIDDGPGIPDAERESVFERGYTTDEDGTGYGLAIVAEIADAHDWDVRIRDAAGGGARIEVRTGQGLAPEADAQSNSTSED